MPDRSTIYEVAQRSGVSTATVSRVMADGKGFSEATRERVRNTAAELGWVPSEARGLASKRAGVVGLLFPDLGQSGEAEEESPLYVDQVIRGAERAATSVGDAVMIAATRTASGRDLAFSIAGKTDGLVVMARSLSETDIAALSRSVPVVVLAGYSAEDGPDFVGADNRSGSREITAHLIEVHGHTDLAFLAGPADSPDSGERFEGFREALRQAGLPVPGEPAATGGFTEAGGRQAVAAMLAGGRDAAGHRVRQRRDGDRGADRAAGQAAARPGGRRGDRVRRHRRGAPPPARAHHGPPADARAGRAVGPDAARPHHRPGRAAAVGDAADQDRDPPQLRVPPPAHRQGPA